MKRSIYFAKWMKRSLYFTKSLLVFMTSWHNRYSLCCALLLLAQTHTWSQAFLLLWLAKLLMLHHTLFPAAVHPLPLGTASLFPVSGIAELQLSSFLGINKNT